MWTQKCDCCHGRKLDTFTQTKWGWLCSICLSAKKSMGEIRRTYGH